MTSECDSQQRFIFEHFPIRGDIVRLDASYQAVMQKHLYPSVVQQQLGQALVSSLLMAAGITFQGSLTLQIQGDGPMNLLLAQSDFERHVRGLAKWQGKIDVTNLADLVGEAHIMITIDPGGGGQRYNAYVELQGETLAESIAAYFQQSEQIPTVLCLAANAHHAVGLLLQRMPHENNPEIDEKWDEIQQLTQTLTEEELLQLDNQTILHRLYHQQDIRLFDFEPVSFHCHCSSDKIERTIRALGYREVVEQLQQDDTKLDVICEFCNHHYHYDRVDIERIFAANIQSKPPPSTKH